MTFRTFRRFRRSVLLLAMIAGCLGYDATSASGQETIVGWHSTLESAQQAARESGKPIFLVFRCVR